MTFQYTYSIFKTIMTGRTAEIPMTTIDVHRIGEHQIHQANINPVAFFLPLLGRTVGTFDLIRSMEAYASVQVGEGQAVTTYANPITTLESVIGQTNFAGFFDIKPY